MTTADNTAARPRPMLWGGLFFLNTALIAAGHILDMIEQPVPLILFALNMVLLVPMTRAARQKQEQKGAMSPALRIYNRRIMACGALYMVAMIGGGNLFDRIAEGSPVLWLMALLPTAPVLGMIWSMYRYYADEEDEFLRHRAVVGALVGLVIVLVLGTVWGFLETYGLVPHVWNWWVFPVWAIGLGIGTCWPGPRDGESE